MTPEGHLAIADYGLAVTGVDDNTRMHDVCGTPGYTAPEMVEHDEYGLALDIWGFGIILFEMYTGKVSPACFYSPVLFTNLSFTVVYDGKHYRRDPSRKCRDVLEDASIHY